MSEKIFTILSTCRFQFQPTDRGRAPFCLGNKQTNLPHVEEWGVGVAGYRKMRVATAVEAKSSKKRTAAVLVVEDDLSTRKLITRYLGANGYHAVEAASLDQARQLLGAINFEALVLDLQLEDGDGIDLLSDLGVTQPSTIVVSASHREIDRVNCLEKGADDFMMKPINLRELALRLQRTLLRSEAPESHAVVIDEGAQLSLHLVERGLFVRGKRIATLPKREFDILRILFEQKGKIVKREYLSQEVMGRRVLGDSRAVDMLVSAVRKKLRECRSECCVKSIRGEGYVFEKIATVNNAPDDEREFGSNNRLLKNAKIF